jgi:DNA polymerase-3 subunit delta'
MPDTVFNQDISHTEIQQRILHAIKNNRLSHAFLFHGKEGAGKEAFAVELAKLLNCEKGPLFICQKCSQCIKIGNLEHPDLKFVFPVPRQSNTKPDEIADAVQIKAANPYRRVIFPGKNSYISIDSIRELKYEAKFKLYEGKKKVFIISEADQMRPEAANALLKILEEPPQNLMLILITSKIHKILPTIRSRAQLVHFPPHHGDVMLKIIKSYIASPPDHLSRIIRLSLGNIKLAFDFIENDIIRKRDQAVEFLRKVVVLEKSHEFMTELYNISGNRDRRNMFLLLFFLLTWFHDAHHCKVNPASTDYLINSDLKNNLEGFVKGYPHADYHELIRTTQSAIGELEDPRNLNPTLIFTNLSIKLNRLIKQN